MEFDNAPLPAERESEDPEIELRILVQMAKNLTPVYEKMKPTDPDYTFYANFISDVRQLRESWPRLQQDDKNFCIGDLRKLYTSFMNEKS